MGKKMENKDTDTKAPKDIKEQIKEEIKEASHIMKNGADPKKAAEHYHTTLTSITKDSSKSGYGKKLDINEDIVVLRYVYARACIATNNYDSIVLGLKQLEHIYNSKLKPKFPAVYLGYVDLYMKMNRYELASNYIHD